MREGCADQTYFWQMTMTINSSGALSGSTDYYMTPEVVDCADGEQGSGTFRTATIEGQRTN